MYLYSIHYAIFSVVRPELKVRLIINNLLVGGRKSGRILAIILNSYNLRKNYYTSPYREKYSCQCERTVKKQIIVVVIT